MVGTIPATIPEDKPLSSNAVKTLFKLIKVYANDDDDLQYCFDSKDNISLSNKSHTQLFYNITNKTKTDLSGCKPSYCREVFRPNDKINNLYWYKEALRPVSSSAEPEMSWAIDQVKVKKSLGRVKRPRVFSINNDALGSNSVFEYGAVDGEPKGYSGDVVTPYDNTSIQRYRWVRYKDGSRWALIARNDPNTTLVEFRKTSSENEFDVAFLKSPPLGWKINNNQDLALFGSSDQFMGRYPSVFSNPSTYRSSTTSGFLSNRESSFSDTYSRNSSAGGNNKDSRLFSTYSENNNNNNPNKDSRLFSTYSENNLLDLSDSSLEKYWQEFVLASTVVIQDEVNSNKRRLWKKSE